MIRAALAALALIATPASAGSIQLHLASEHASGCDGCNESNWGIGYMGDGPGFRLTGGYYTNSWFRDSFYVGTNTQLWQWGSVSLVGITGYAGTSDSADELMIFDELLPVPLLHIDTVPSSPVSPLLTMAPTSDGVVTLLSLNVEF